MNTDLTTLDPLKDVQRGLECFLDPRVGLIETQRYPICVLPWKNMILVDVFAVCPTAPQHGYQLTHYGLN